MRVGVLRFGTVNWELDVMRHHGLAERAGLEVQITPLASTRATAVALQGGAVDAIVSDWIWVSRQRADGRDYVFVPYSVAVGGLLVRADAGIESLQDLRGKRVGVAGGPVDKSWLLLRAYARVELGQDLVAMVEPSFAAPPLLNKLAERGDLDAVLNYWHYGARLEAAGMRELLGVREILPALGVERPMPLLGWVFSEAWAANNGDALRGFLRASYAAKKILSESDEEWDRIAPLTKAEDAATLASLREAYRAGVPQVFGAAEREAAARAFEVLAREGGRELVGHSETLQPGTFWPGFELPQP
ncbi:MAG: ABC transporter substrate-binding protein [Gammaproteobacteria bacterium]